MSKTQPVHKSPVLKLALVQLRHTPINLFSMEAMQQMLRDKDFFDQCENESGKGIQHHYENLERQGVQFVHDHATGLTWQQSGLKNYVSFEKAADCIRQLNTKNYGGHADWRLPTLEEAMSLMESEKHGDLYLASIFDHQQSSIWAADKESSWQVWVVDFKDGICNLGDVGGGHCARAVRS